MAGYLDSENFELDDSTPLPFFISSYLDSPILTVPLEKFKEGISFWKDLDIMGNLPAMRAKLKLAPLCAKEVFNACQTAGDVDDYHEIDPFMLPDIYHYSAEIPSEEKTLQLASEIASTIYTSATRGLDAWVGGGKEPSSAGQHILNSFSLEASKDEMYWYKRWKTWDILVTSVEERYSRGKTFFVSVTLGTGITLYTNTKVVLLNIKEPVSFGSRTLMTWDQILMVKDLCLTRMQAYSATRVIHSGDPLLSSAIGRLIAWHESCLRRYGNRGFGILKQSEGLSKAYLSLVSDDGFGLRGSYSRMVEKIKVKELAIGLNPLELSLAETFVDVVKPLRTIQQVVEIFGLQKISGHPLVDPAAGMRSVKETCTAPSSATFKDSQEIGWNFCRMFLETYVRQKGWPNMIFNDKTTTLYDLYSKQRRFLTRNSYPLSDWASCRFGRVFEFDFAPNYLELMDDKSISQYRDNIASNWDKDIPAQSERRLLLELLQRRTVDARHLIHMVMYRIIPESWKIVCLYPKEREFKDSARMFAMMVFEMRLVWALLESNLADNVFKYISPQTMTKDRLDVLKTFLSLTNPVDLEEYITMFLEMDLSSWCQHQRRGQVYPVGMALDDLFDMPGAYTYIHDFFEDSMMVCRVAGLRPTDIHLNPPPESGLLYYHDLAGKEGISQKEWTLGTYSFMDLSVKDMDLSYQLIGQADNQVMSIRLPRDKTIPYQDQLVRDRDKVLASVSDRCSRSNQDLKPDECLESTTVLTYSKDVFVKGLIYPTSLKFHSRLFPHSSQDFPSVRTNVGAIFSTAIAGAERSCDPVKSYYLALFHSSLYLLDVAKGRGTHGPWFKTAVSQLSKLNLRDAIMTMLLIPSELGGLPVGGICSFMYKGGSDPLSKALSSLMLTRLGSRSRIPDRILAQLDQDSLYKESKDLMSLLKDPYSIPLKTPVSPLEQAVEATIENLKPRIVNTAVYELLDNPVNSYTDNLVECLAKVQPFNPLILRDILECSVYGISETIRKMFVATRTIQSVARGKGSSIPQKVLVAERESIRSVLKRYQTLPASYWRPRSPYVMCQELRSRWKKCECPTPEGVSSYGPFDFKLFSNSMALTTVGVHAVLLSDSRKAMTERGPYDPYLGNKTREKRSEHGYKIIRSDTTSEAFRKLQRIVSQTQGDPSFARMVDLVGLSRSDTVLSHLSQDLEGRAGGTHVHRYDSISGHQDAYAMGCPNFYTHCLISSDHSGKLEGGAFDYNVMIQQLYLVLEWSLQYVNSKNPGSVSALAFDTESAPLDILPEIKLSIPPDVQVPYLSFKNNPLAFLDRIKIERIGPSADMVRELPNKFSRRNIRLEYAKDQRMILEGWVSSALRNAGAVRVGAEGGYSESKSQVMDIAEILSNGVEAIIHSAVNAICDHYLLNNLRSGARDKERWNRIMFIQACADVVAPGIGSHLGNRNVRKDPAVLRFNLLEGPNYDNTTSRVQSRLKSVLVGEALRRLKHPTELYYARESASFSVAVGYSDVEALASVIARLLYGMVFHTYLSRGDRKHIIDSFLLPVLRMKSGDPTKLIALDRSMHAVAKWLEKKGAQIASDYLTKCHKGHYLRFYRTSVEEALRMTRTLSLDPSGDTVLIKRRTRTDTLKDITGRVEFQFPEGKHDTKLFDSESSVELKDFHTEEYFVERYRVNSARRPGLPASLFSQIICFSELMNGRTVICVGVGEGYTSAAALVSGARAVVGVELRRDIPFQPQRFLDYKPPVVIRTGLEDMFHFHESCLLDTGDWFKKSVSLSIREDLPDESVLLFDIESGLEGHIFTLLEPLIGWKEVSMILIRTEGSVSHVAAWMRDLTLSKVKPKCFLLRRTSKVVQALFVILGPVHQLMLGSDICKVTIPQDCVRGDEYSSVQPYEVQVSDAIFNVIDCPHGTPIKVVGDVIKEMISNVSSDPLAHMKFNRWTSFLRASLVASWLQLTDIEREAMLREWIRTSVGHSPVVEGYLPMRVDTSFLMHVTGVASRALLT